MSHLLYHTACPQCRQEGLDRTGNNLGVYSDGHSYCYACGFLQGTNAITKYKSKAIPKQEKNIFLPEDVEFSFPEYARKWLEQYEFDQNTLINNKIMWSQSSQKIIFPYYINGVLEGWQGRVFDPNEKEKRKWFSQGYLDDILYTLGKDSPCLVLCESIVSAIKISRFNKAMPLYGSVISANKWARLSHLSNKIILWLDPDKKIESIQMAKEGHLFIDQVSPLLTERKPKDYTYQEIREILDAARTSFNSPTFD